MKLYRLCIGANNETGEVETDKVRSLTLDSFADGFTLIEGAGVWKGGGEPMIIVEIVTEDTEKVYSLATLLKEELKQQAVLLQETPAVIAFV